MQNIEITRLFEELADLLEIQNANPFRVRAYRNAARMLGDLPESVAEIVADPTRSLEDLPGIGKDLAEKIRTEINAVLEKYEDFGGIEAVFFTSFVVQ